MRKGVINFLLVLPLLGAVMLFSACTLPFGSSSQKVKPYERPSWAVNKPGTITLNIPDLPPIIEYDPNTGYNSSFSLTYTSTIYTGEHKEYAVKYNVISSITGPITNGTFNAEEADYDNIKGKIYPFEGNVKENLRFIIPKGLEGLTQANLLINYNISGLETKILIPLDVRRPPAGTISTLKVPIYYSASPLVPTSDEASVEVAPYRIIVSFSVGDAIGCLSNYQIPPVISYTYSLRYYSSSSRAGAAGGVGSPSKSSMMAVNERSLDYHKIRHVYYATTPIAPSSGRTVSQAVRCLPGRLRSFPDTIECIIDMTKMPQDIRQAFNSEAGVYLELSINIGPYECRMSRMYTISIRKLS